MIGFKNLKKGIQKYMKKFQFRNTTHNDFIECIEEVLPKNKNFNFKKWCL